MSAVYYCGHVPGGREDGMASLGPAVTARIARWQPSSVSPQAACFAREVVTRAAPHGRERAKNLLRAAAKLADSAIGPGLEPVPGVLLHPSVTERFTAGAPGLSGPARRTRALTCGSWPGALSRSWAPRLLTAPRRSPATWRWPARSRRWHGGCGRRGWSAWAPVPRLTGTDLRQARGSDIACRSGGVIAQVRGRRPRMVPVPARYHGPLLASAAFAGNGLVTGGRDPGRRNVTTPLISSLAGGTGLPRLDTGRLRATWLAGCAQLPGLATFMTAAGITCSQRPGDLIATLDPADEAGAVALPGAAR
jgi:hypothetical protein